MELVEEGDIGQEVGHEQGLDLVVIRVFRNQAMAMEDPARVSIADEDRFLTSKQQDAVGGLRADARDPEQFFPEERSIPYTHCFVVPPVLFVVCWVAGSA